jgi:hypothetical protein
MKQKSPTAPVVSSALLGARLATIAMFGAMLMPLPFAAAHADEHKPSLMAYLYAPAAEVTSRYGAPKSTQTLSDGSTVLAYEWTKPERRGGYTVSNAGPLYSGGLPDGMPYNGSPFGLAREYVPMQTVQLPCEAEFTVGKDGTVREINWQGEGCWDD